LDNFSDKNFVIAAGNSLADGAFQARKHTSQKRGPGFPAVPGNIRETVQALAREAVGNLPLIGG
jgi:hypothetical protein